jgi:hypothetical protein
MKALSHCPKCHNPLMNTYKRGPTPNQGYWIKDCIHFTDHNFLSRTIQNDDNQLSDLQIAIRMKPYIVASWDFCENTLKITYTIDNIIYLPFFEPDFADFSALVKKLRTYLVFA